MAKGCIYKLLNLWNWKRVLRKSLIKICKIHTHPPLAYLLFNNNGVGQPFGIENFFDIPNLFQVIDLLFYSISVHVECSLRALLLRYYGRVHIQVMAYEIQIDP